MPIRILITVVFGLLWWWLYNHVGAGLTYLMILGSVLAVCVCCCKGNAPPEWGYNFNWDNYFACIQRCRWATLTLTISLFIIGVLVVFYTTGKFPSGVDLTNIVLVAIGAPLFVRAICCAYD